MLIVKDEDGKKVKMVDDRPVLDFGIVEVGASKKKTWKICNEYESEVTNIEVAVDDDNVKVVEVPERLQPGECGELVLEYKPPLKVKRGLKANVAIVYVVEP